MSQINSKLRKIAGGYAHWCPGCGYMHSIITHSDPAFPGPVWTFDGNLESPTFGPSVNRGGVKKIVNERGEWVGGWELDASGKPLPNRCHYFLRAGQLEFCGDSLHTLAGKTVPLPNLPPSHCDEGREQDA